MKCKNCSKRFSEAGNIKNYVIVCPHCKHTQVKFNTQNQNKKNEVSKSEN